MVMTGDDSFGRSFTWLRHTKVVLLAVELIKQRIETSSDVPTSLQAFQNLTRPAKISATS